MLDKHLYHFESVSVGTKVIIKMLGTNICSWNSTEQNNNFTFILVTKLQASLNNSCGWALSLSRAVTDPFGKKMLIPEIKLLCPLNNSFTMGMTPGTLVLQEQTMAYPLGFRFNVHYAKTKTSYMQLLYLLALKLFMILRNL